VLCRASFAKKGDVSSVTAAQRVSQADLVRTTHRYGRIIVWLDGD
jgi:hypothetical protein